jgi:hypothetical protein
MNSFFKKAFVGVKCHMHGQEVKPVRVLLPTPLGHMAKEDHI